MSGKGEFQATQCWPWYSSII